MTQFAQSIVVLLLLISFNSHSQVKEVSLEVKYPIGVGKNFLGENYNGIIEPGIRFRFLNKEQYALGASMAVSVHKIDNSGYYSNNIKVISVFYQPNLFYELNFKKPDFLHLSINVGYTALAFYSDNSDLGSNDISDQGETYNGINVGGGLIIDITNQLFMNASYGFIRLPDNQGIPKSGFNQNISMLGFGLGIRL